jgi:alkanesulfonate monooxygenase SsuD/methylene tetrahydromethanopterin reductase-like flavin-dependent oxidoreductase (luciferase family)
MEFGVFDHLDHGTASLGETYEMRLVLAEDYDRAGFYAYHQAEHHSTPLGAAPSPSLFLAALAQRTKRLRFGPLVYTLPLYHPLRLAEEICMLDQMSGGRLQVGIGRGISPHEVRFYGIDPADTQPMYVEALELILKALQSAGQDITFHGRYYTFDSVPIVMAPVQKPYPPLWYGVARPDSVTWAAANGVNIVGNVAVEMMRAITDRYRAEWTGDPVALPLMGTSRHIVVAETDAEALDIARRAYRVWFASFMNLWDKCGGIPPNARFPDEFDGVVALGKAIAGSPQTVRDTLEAQAAGTGVNYLLCRFAFGDLTLAEARHSVDLFARHVMPEFGLPQRRAA